MPVTVEYLLLPRAPATKENHVGLELEFASELGREALAELMLAEPWAKYANIGTDSTAKWGEWRGIEIRLCIPQKELSAVIPAISEWCGKLKIRVHPGCGFHVHLDMRNRDAKLCFSRLLNFEKGLYKLVKPARRESDYCRPIQQRAIPIRSKPTSQLEQSASGILPFLPHHELSRAMRPLNATNPEQKWEYYNWLRLGEPKQGHYNAVNIKPFETHRTIEVRMHHGTVDGEEILNWVNLLILVIDSDYFDKRVSLLTKVYPSIDKEKPELGQYMRSAYRRYKNVQS
jgi:hypothetical protein